jgi:pilus assembly protein Flp/PilA
MLALWTKVTNWMSDEEKGASMVEYALLVALIAVIAIVAVTTLGREVSDTFTAISDGVSGAN